MLIGTVLFLSLIVILLAMPVTLTFRFSWKETLSAKLRLNWAFGLVHADVSPDPEKPSADKKEAHRKKDVWRPGGFRKTTNVVAAIQQPRFRRRMLRFMADLWHAVHKKNVWLRGRLGLGDPADTGQLWGMLGPLSGMLARLRDIRIQIEPDFLDPTLEVDSSGTIRVIPLQVVGIMLGLLFSPAVWRGVLSMRTSG